MHILVHRRLSDQSKSCPDNKFDTEDSGNGIIRFENGASLLFEASWAINGAPHTDTQIFGSKAGANLSPLTIYGERNGFLSDDVVNVGAEGNKFERELWHFADCVLNGKEVVYPIDQAVMMQQMLNGIYDSATSGKEIVF